MKRTRLIKPFIFIVLSCATLSTTNFSTISDNNGTLTNEYTLQEENLAYLDSILGTMPSSESNLSMESNLSYYYQTSLKSVATILNCTSSRGVLTLTGWGSSVIYNSDDTYYYFITNSHVVEDGDVFYCITHTGQKAIMTLLGNDELQDVACLRIEKTALTDVLVAPLAGSTIAEMKSPKAGSSIYAIGTPAQLQMWGTLTTGSIAGVDRNILEATSDTLYTQSHGIQMNLSINSGNSGGPTFNAYGEVIGINSLKITNAGPYEMEGINFCLPIHDMYIGAERIRTSYISDESLGEFTKASLGSSKFKDYGLYTLVERTQLNIPSDVGYGVVISSMDLTSELFLEGCDENTIIRAIDGETIDGQVQLRSKLYEYLPGDVITLTVRKMVDGVYDAADTDVSITLIKYVE